MSSAADTDLSEALAQAERRREILAELAEIGLHLARQVGAHAAAAMAAINEEHGGDPTRAFATVSRSIRLTLAMEARNDGHIVALRNGRLPAGWTGVASWPASASSPAGAPSRRLEEQPREALVDREDLEAFLGLTFEAGVDTIRQDLGVEAEALEIQGDGRPVQAQRARGITHRVDVAASATAGVPAPPPACLAATLGIGARRRE